MGIRATIPKHFAFKDKVLDQIILIIYLLLDRVKNCGTSYFLKLVVISREKNEIIAMSEILEIF